jgi:phospholipid/cholesterol/gamma-HCH transport system permease protein
VREYLELNLRIIYWAFIAPFLGKPFKVTAVMHQMLNIGVQAIPMAALTSFSIGLTLAMQGAHELARLGAESYTPNLVIITILRELGPLLVGTVVIGRSGSAITAELGTMKVSEEIKALEVMAINPIRYLVVPRFLAMLVMLPVLTVMGDYIGLMGGWSICHFALNMDTSAYIGRMIDNAVPMDRFVFAWLIATISCKAGLEVEGGAEGVGQSTTSSVVTSILTMLVADAILTGVFFFASTS